MSNCNRDPKELNAIYEHYKAHPLRIEISYEGVQKPRSLVDLSQFEPVGDYSKLKEGAQYYVTDGKQCLLCKFGGVVNGRPFFPVMNGCLGSTCHFPPTHYRLVEDAANA